MSRSSSRRGSKRGSKRDSPGQTVLVTGATGFVAGHVVSQLLTKGYTVHGTVRSVKPDRVGWLQEMEGASDRLRLFEADLLTPGAFDEAIKGCDAVLHVASPYVMNPKNPQKDLVDPAVKGTEAICDAVARCESVKTLVVTSSMAAVMDCPVPDHVYTEKDWNTESSLTRLPYYYSKVMAEKAAWAWAEEHKNVRVLTMNPFMVIGPTFTPGRNVSNMLIANWFDGATPGLLPLGFGIVDVRDVAAAHIQGLEHTSATGRHILIGGFASHKEAVAMGVKTHPELGKNAPTIDISGSKGAAFLRLASWAQPKDTGKYLRNHLGNSLKFKFDTTKAREELGVTFRPLEETLGDTLTDLISKGFIKPKGEKKK